MIKRKTNEAVSLIEILVVMTIFAALGIIVARSIILTLRGAKKSEGITAVRENLNYAVGIIERQLRNANSVPQCPNIVPFQSLDYYDQNGLLTNFSCIDVKKPSSFIASGSGNLRLTSSAVIITSCRIECVQTAGSTRPAFVDIYLQGVPANLSGLESSFVSVSTRIYLRNY